MAASFALATIFMVTPTTATAGSVRNSRPAKILWTENRKLGRGSITAADGLLYCCSEKDGVVVLVEASPKAGPKKAA